MKPSLAALAATLNASPGRQRIGAALRDDMQRARDRAYVLRLICYHGEDAVIQAMERRLCRLFHTATGLARNYFGA
jgi:hypothetical protein